jgi:hypothetical protein
VKTEAYRWKRGFDPILERGPTDYADLTPLAIRYTMCGEAEPDPTLVEDP